MKSSLKTLIIGAWCAAALMTSSLGMADDQPTWPTTRTIADIKVLRVDFEHSRGTSSVTLDDGSIWEITGNPAVDKSTNSMKEVLNKGDTIVVKSPETGNYSRSLYFVGNKYDGEQKENPKYPAELRHLPDSSIITQFDMITIPVPSKGQNTMDTAITLSDGSRWNLSWGGLTHNDAYDVWEFFESQKRSFINSPAMVIKSDPGKGYRLFMRFDNGPLNPPFMFNAPVNPFPH